MPVAGGLLSRRWAAVLGSPVAHSLSPVLHRAAYADLGLDWTYDARECTAAGLPAVLAAARADGAFGGFSLTMPLKEAVLPLVDAIATDLGAVNTVVPGPEGLRGSNTDVDGVLAALGELAPGPGRAAVLGAGGTARAAVAALHRLGREVDVLARRPGGALLGAPVLGWDSFNPSGYAVVVSTVPAGATDALAARGWPSTVALLDVVYVPWPTALAAAALAAGAPVVGGLAVLVGQAVEQVRLMTGQLPSVPVVRAAGESALRR